VDMEKYPDRLKGLEATPPLHDIFYQIKGPAVGDVLANFVQRYNGARFRHADVTSNMVAPVTSDQIKKVENGIEVQVLRTIAPGTYRHRFFVLVRQLLLWLLGSLVPAAYRETRHGDRGIRELYLNVLGRAGKGSLVYIENQYFFDHGIISEIHEAAERGAKIIALLTSKPDEGLLQGKVESLLEKIADYQEESKKVAGHKNVALLTLGNCRPDPRTPGKFIFSETYIHSKNMAVITPDWAIMTGGSANIAFTSMWFHSEINIAFMDPDLIKNWVAQLWSEHLQVPAEQAKDLIEKPDVALTFFRMQADNNKTDLNNEQGTTGRVYDWKETDFPDRNLTGINLNEVKIGEGC
jgi:phosphatidylserine/phosphatidylglycerophosphate/cardiolipin synthase-like enzyme